MTWDKVLVESVQRVRVDEVGLLKRQAGEGGKAHGAMVDVNVKEVC